MLWGFQGVEESLRVSEEGPSCHEGGSRNPEVIKEVSELVWGLC